MTAATKDVLSPKLGTEDTPPPALLALPCASNVLIYGGTFAASDASGNCVPCTSSAALMLWGRVERQINNLNTNTPFGAAGAQVVTIRPGVYYFANDGTITAAMVGQPCYALDDNTVTSNPTVAGATYWLPFAGIIMPPAVGEAGTSLPTNTRVPVYVGFPSPTTQVLHATIDVPLATIQAQTTATAFNLGPVTPANLTLLDHQVSLITPLTGGGETHTTFTLQGGTDAGGTLVSIPSGAADLTTGAAGASFSGYGATNGGTNPYSKRGGQQIKGTLTQTGGTLAGLTAGHFTVDLFYAILQ